jgi:DNA-binding IclR family transcriptional regulator
VLEAKAAKTGKAAFPANEIEQTALVMSLLAEAPAPLSAAQIAAGFRRPGQIEPNVAAILRSLTRMGHLTSIDDGRSFTLRRAA